MQSTTGRGGNTVHSCTICGFSASRKTTIWSHVRFHSKPKLFHLFGYHQQQSIVKQLTEMSSTGTSVCVYACMCVRLCVCMYACMCVRLYVCTSVCMCVRLYVCTSVCMYVRLCVCMYVCVCPKMFVFWLYCTTKSLCHFPCTEYCTSREIISLKFFSIM